MQITCIVQARMGSERCPGKSMEKIGGVPVIEIVLKRIASANNIDNVVLATSVLERDSVLADHAARIGFSVYRGSEADLVARFHEAAKLYASNNMIIRATGDNVFMDWNELDRLVEYGVSGDWDFVGFKNEKYSERLNDFAGEFIRIEALERVRSLTQDTFDREHVFPYFYNHPELFKIDRIQVHPSLITSTKLDLDYPQDLSLMKLIGERIEDPVTIPSSDVVVIADKISKGAV